MANLKDFLLPDLGEGLTEGEIVSWLVAVGDVIDLNQPVAEIETAKAVVEVPSPFAGTVTTLHGEVGDEIEVGTPLVTIDLEGGSVAPAEAVAPPAAAAPSGGPGVTPADAQTGDAVPAASAGGDQGTVADDGGSGNVLVGYGTGGGRSRRRRGQPSPGPAAGGGPAAGAPPGRPGRPLAKPPVRKLAKDLGVDLAQVRGSGEGGTITREDVERAAAGNGHRAEADRGAAASDGVIVTDTEHHRLPSAPPNEELVDRIPVRGVRKVIAEKMTLSRQEIPEATTWVDCDATPLWRLRERLRSSYPDERVSPLAILLRACVAGLQRFPELNASLDTDTNEIVVHRYVNLGFAAQTARGLVVPVIKGADRMSLIEIARELNRLAAAAREAKVTPDEMVGGTFTVSNYGSFGVDGGSAVINHPEAAILGVGRITDRPWVHKGKVKPRKVMQLSIAFDHRICDGGEAAGFLRFMADAVEDPTKLVASL
jgi:2-oxoisovalerate dehydrogenase E2 component (dihydrolipoyl transacylase)